jgi:cobalt/nickel transport system permease protein
MHIPDGFLDAKTAVATGTLAVAGIGWSLRQARRQLPARRVPLLGLAAAFIFAAQMLNFPVAAGTSGHLVGGVLAAVLLGPSAAVVVMTAVLILQCFLFNDGGVTALGANIFNMALVAPLAGYTIYRGVHRLTTGLRGMVLAAAFAGWGATVAAAVSCAGQLAVSGTVAWGKVFTAMAGVHMLIGLGEGAITALVLAAVARTRPELIEEGVPTTLRKSYRDVLVYGLLLALGLAVFVAPFACGWPDGLEKVAGVLGFEHRAPAQPVLMAPLPDYKIPGMESARWGTAVVGVAGTVVAFALAWLLARILAAKEKS